MLEFFIDNLDNITTKAIVDEYGNELTKENKLKPYTSITREEAISQLSRDAINYRYSKIYVSSLTNVCKCRFWKLFCKHKEYQEYVMCLDCDSELNMLAAARYLNISGIGYSIIKSSEAGDSIPKPPQLGPQWPQGIQGPQLFIQAVQVPTDHYWIITDFVSDLMSVANKMKSIPGVDHRYANCVFYRKTVLLRAYPKDDKMPIFPDSHSLTNTLAVKWYESFKNYWLSKDMVSLMTARELQLALVNGNIKTMIMNPNFVV
jgi:hypothetical protein